jgi:hypothetical protein
VRETHFSPTTCLPLDEAAALMISVDTIVSSVHLFPRFVQNSSPPEDWNSFSILEHCHSFYINPLSDRDTFLLFS